MEIIKRSGKGSHKTRVHLGSKILVLDTADLCRDLGVREIIRVWLEEYPEKASAGEVLNHFNMPLHSDLSGYKAVIAKIEKHGIFENNKKEDLPLLSLENVWKVRVVSSKTYSSYSDLSESIFDKTIGNIGNAEELQKVILKRYSLVLPKVSPSDIISQGVTVRSVKLLKKITLSM